MWPPRHWLRHLIPPNHRPTFKSPNISHDGKTAPPPSALVTPQLLPCQGCPSHLLSLPCPGCAPRLSPLYRQKAGPVPGAPCQEDPSLEPLFLIPGDSAASTNLSPTSSSVVLSPRSPHDHSPRAIRAGPSTVGLPPSSMAQRTPPGVAPPSQPCPNLDPVFPPSGGAGTSTTCSTWGTARP